MTSAHESRDFCLEVRRRGPDMADATNPTRDAAASVDRLVEVRAEPDRCRRAATH